MTNSEPRLLEGRRVLVTDGEQRAALAIVRSLGAAGARPLVASATGSCLAGASRFAAGEDRSPDPLATPAAYAEWLAATCREHSIEALLPVTEAALRPVLTNRRLFDGIVIPFPAAETFARASDKHRVTQLATELGVPVPRQTVLTSSASGEVTASGLPRFPLVLKPAVSVATDRNHSVKLGVRHVGNAGDLARVLTELPGGAFPLLVQERISGPGIGVFLLRWDGRIVARFAHRRLREKPPSGGVSVYRESIPLPADALAHAEALLEALDWRGVAMVEFKRDRESGIPYLMEINGRFWGSLQLAIDAGVDFPRLLLEAALGRPPVGTIEGRPGIRLRWLLGDLDHLLLRLRRSPAALGLEPDAPGRLRTLGAFALPWRPGERWETLRLSDPAPFRHEMRRWIADILHPSPG